MATKRDIDETIAAIKKAADAKVARLEEKKRKREEKAELVMLSGSITAAVRAGYFDQAAGRAGKLLNRLADINATATDAAARGDALDGGE